MSTLPEIQKTAKQQMHKAVENTQRELASLRSSRANPTHPKTIRAIMGGKSPLPMIGVRMAEMVMVNTRPGKARKTSAMRMMMSS